MVTVSLTLRDFRSYHSLELGLDPGIVLVVGPNGAGKTNLLESLHVATQGFSPRTRADAQLIRFGAEAARVAVRGRRGELAVETDVLLQRSGGKEARLNGARVDRAERLRSELATLVFTPDRLAVVKGGPAVRRAYFDRALGRLLPAQGSLPAAYGEVLGQRNASLRRVGFGLSARDALEPWTARVAELGTELVAARLRTIELLAPGLAQRAGELGLEGLSLEYRAEQLSADALDARLDRDLDRGATGLGPHLDEIAIVAGSRELRSFGSQGEQRLAVLSLLLAEADLIAASRPSPPLLLLDDVLSELDGDRRAALTRGLPPGGQTVITAADSRALPGDADQLVLVEPGKAYSP